MYLRPLLAESCWQVLRVCGEGMGSPIVLVQILQEAVTKIGIKCPRILFGESVRENEGTRDALLSDFSEAYQGQTALQRDLL